MPKPTIKGWPPKLKKALDELLAEDRYTIDELVNHMKELGGIASRSTMGRHKQNFEKVAKRMRESRAMAETLVAELGPASAEGKTGRLLAEMLQGIVFNDLMSRNDPDDDNPGATTQEMARLAKCLKDLASASKIDVDRERAITDLVKRQAAAEAKSGAKAAGLTEETAQKIYDQVLGVRRRAA